MAACAAVLALATAGGTARAADASGVIADYRADARIDAGHSVADLQAALASRVADPQLPGFAAAVQDELDEFLLGRSAGDGATTVPAAGADVGDRTLRSLEITPEAAGAPSALTLPEPRAPGEATHPPWPFVGLSAAAGLLAMCGLVSGLYRRARRPAQPAR